MRTTFAIGAVALCLALPAAAGAASYSNATPLGPAENAPLPPYPSSIPVSAERGTITSVTATLVGIGGAAIRDLDALLVGPGGSSMLLSDACSSGLIPDWTGQSITLDDRVGTTIPDPCPSGGFPTGSYRPVNFDSGPDNFPGVPPPYVVSLAAFNGRSPNGVWSLYVVDDGGADASTVSGGWRLDITTTGAPPAKKRKCKKRKAKSAVAAKKKCKKKKRK